MTSSNESRSMMWSLALEIEISLIWMGHSRRSKRPCWKHHAFSFPGSSLLSVARRPQRAVPWTSTPLCLSVGEEAYNLYKLLTGYSLTVGMMLPPMKNRWSRQQGKWFGFSSAWPPLIPTWRGRESGPVALMYRLWTGLLWLHRPWMPSMVVRDLHF